jgi:hypothetical protein
VLQVPVPDGHEWLRVVDPVWTDPIDASHSMENGGRWNPPRSWAALYLNFDLDTARLQVLRLLEGTPFLADDLADDAFDLVAVMLPNSQTALDVVSEVGVAAVGLPASYPATGTGVAQLQPLTELVANSPGGQLAAMRCGTGNEALTVTGVEAVSLFPGAVVEQSRSRVMNCWSSVRVERPPSTGRAPASGITQAVKSLGSRQLKSDVTS